MQSFGDPKKLVLFRYGLLALLVTLVYAGTLNHGFVWDDRQIIVQNPLLQSMGNIPRLFLSEDTAIGYTGYYRPVTYLSFLMDRAVWGVNPTGYHLTNLVLHICAVLLFHAVTAALFGRQRLALAAALLFALHPVAGETVNFLSGGRNTLLAACFTLASLLFYIRKKRIAALAFFTVAIFSKEFALLLPSVLLFYDCRIRRESIRLSSYLPYLVPIAGYLTLRSLAVHQANFLSRINLTDALAAPYLVVRYLVNLAAPFQLKVLYDLHPGALASMLCLGVIAAVTVGLYLLRKNDALLFGAFWFFLFLLPVINIIPLEQSALMADRYAYFSLMGFAISLAAVACVRPGRGATVAVAALCAVYCVVSFQRNSAWQNERNFFTRMTIDAPEKFDGFQNLGMLHYKQGDIAGALPHLSAALSKPGMPAMFLIGSASVFWKENLLDKAESSLLRALQLDPANPEPYLMLITLYEASGRDALARQYRAKTEGLFGGAARMMQSRNAALCREGEAYLARQQYLPAENVFWQALMSDPAYVPALIGMAELSAGRGDWAGAVSYLNRAIAIEPSNNRARYALSRLYRMQGLGK